MEIIYSHGRISPEEVIKHLSLTGQGHSQYAEIIKNKEVLKKAKELGLEVPLEELQDFADRFRYSQGLLSSEETLRAFRDLGLTEEDFEEFCELSLLRTMVQDRLADKKKMGDYFFNNRAKFDRARISRIIAPKESIAREILIQVAEEGADFHALARKHSLDDGTKYAGGYIGILSRTAFSPEIASKVFNAAPGDILGPFPRDMEFQLILVEEVFKPESSEEVREMIKEMIFDEWASQFLEGEIKVAGLKD